MNINIRSETPFDVELIEWVTIEAFRNAPHADHNEHAIVRALRNAGALAISLVAENQGQVIGHVAVSPVTIADGSTDWFGLGPISVLPEHQNAGIGSLLMHHALRELTVGNAAGCVLLGDPAYYARFGFKPEPDLILPGVPAEYFQAILLNGTMPSGKVAYHEAFYI